MYELAIYQLSDPQLSVVSVLEEGQSTYARILEEVAYDPYGRPRRTAQGDFNHDGAINSADYYAFLAAYSASSPACDENDDGARSVADFTAFLGEYAARDPTPRDRISASLIDNPYGYCGYRADEETAAAKVLGPSGGCLYQVRHRVYDPVAGRWLSRDPAGFVDGMNLYQYCSGDSIGCFDPMGLEPVSYWDIARQYPGAVWNRLTSPVRWAVHEAFGTNEKSQDAKDFQANKDFDKKTNNNVVTGPPGADSDAVDTARWVHNREVSATEHIAKEAAEAGHDLYGEGLAEQGLVSAGIGVVGKIRGAGEAVEEGLEARSGSTRSGRGTTNPYGSKGKPDHQALVDELERRAQSELKPGEQVRREKQLQGHDSRRRPDVQIVDENGKTRKVFEAERKPDGRYHKDRLEEYKRLGIECETHPVNPPSD